MRFSHLKNLIQVLFVLFILLVFGTQVKAACGTGNGLFGGRRHRSNATTTTATSHTVVSQTATTSVPVVNQVVLPIRSSTTVIRSRSSGGCANGNCPIAR